MKHKRRLINPLICRMFYLYTMETPRARPVIVSVGEALVDFVSIRSGSLTDSAGFVKRLGGEGANVAVGLAKLGARSVFFGRVGDDPFGRFLVRELKRHRVDVRGVVRDREYRTRLAFVSLTRSGERDFDFWENPPAGSRLQWDDLSLDEITRAHIINVAPLLLLSRPSRSTAFRLAKHLFKFNRIVAFDANIRLALWSSASEVKRVTIDMIRLSTILRVNREEALFLTGTRNLKRAASTLRSWGPAAAAITLGAGGCFLQTAKCEGLWRGFKVRAIDTTGCGDAFFAALLHGIALCKQDPGNIPIEDWTRICVRANAAGALTALKHGGAEAIPPPHKIARFMSRGKP